MNQNFKTKRLSNDTSYKKPKVTLTESLTPEEIKQKLIDYKKVKDIRDIVIGTHVRYFTKLKGTNKPVFRLGGVLTKFGPDYQYVVLSNGTVSWSVQVPDSTFFAKKSLKEMGNEQITQNSNDEVEELKNKLEKMKSIIKEQKNENEKLKDKLDTIKHATIKEQSKKNKK